MKFRLIAPGDARLVDIIAEQRARGFRVVAGLGGLWVVRG
jgi:hypothetical protein